MRNAPGLAGAPASPDGDSLLGGQPHRVVFGDIEGVIEGVDVANDLVTAELGGLSLIHI